MKRLGIVLLCALVVAILGLILWEFEYQHVSLVLWLLVVVAVLWCCAEVAVSLHVLPSVRRRNTRTPSQSRPRRRRWMVTLFGAVILVGLDIVLRLFGFETTSQLIWFLLVIALLWGCAQVSFLLRPEGQGRLTRGVDNQRPVSMSWASKRTFLDRFLPGASMRSGIYNKGNEEVWDGNQNLPPHHY